MNEGPAGRDSCGTLFFVRVGMGGMGVMRQMWVMGHDVSYGRTWDRWEKSCLNRGFLYVRK